MTGRPRGPPRGGPPGPASGPRPPIGGAPPRGDEGQVYNRKKRMKHQTRGETWCDRPQKRGKNTHKGLKLGPFWAPLQGAHPVRFWGGPPAPPLGPGWSGGGVLGGPPAPPYRPILNWTLIYLAPRVSAPPKKAPPGGGSRRAVLSVGWAAPWGPPGGYPPGRGPPAPPAAPGGPPGPPRGPPRTPPGPGLGGFRT
jgi:hypothetical protein